jgi:RNA polymerase sigma-70 factor, ECF subfamily
MTPGANITDLLARWRDGDKEALDELVPQVYSELHRLANHYLRQERADHTLQPTALVHEAYLRLAGC